MLDEGFLSCGDRALLPRHLHLCISATHTNTHARTHTRTHRPRMTYLCMHGGSQRSSQTACGKPCRQRQGEKNHCQHEGGGHGSVHQASVQVLCSFPTHTNTQTCRPPPPTHTRALTYTHCTPPSTRRGRVLLALFRSLLFYLAPCSFPTLRSQRAQQLGVGTLG